MLEPKQIDDYFNASATQNRRLEQPLSKHARLVSLAKIALPSVAAVLAVTLLCFPSLKKDAKEFGIDFTITQGDIEKLNISKTTIYMTDNQNRVNNFIAEQIKETSAGSQIFSLISPEAFITLDNDEWINVKSPNGTFNQKDTTLQLQNGAELFYSRGMSVKTPEVFFNLKTSEGYSKHPVTGEGFIGDITSEGFRFSGKDDCLTFLGKTHITINQESLKEE